MARDHNPPPGGGGIFQDKDPSARNYRPSFRENKPKTLVLYDWKRAFWACFRENWVYKFEHWYPAFHFDADPEPAFHNVTDLDPSDANPASQNIADPDLRKLNMELDLQSLFGLLCTAVLLIGWDPATTPLPPHLGSYSRAPIGQPR